mmetsp:Transcript_15995/g.31636  ORF Transcript_15995/g.31636 Transcript_15995/m.31636 type:complete len:221 (+) Transcript_15995:43-705(+)
MERKVKINAPIARVIRVCSDYDKYGDWTGNGIKKCVIKEKRQGFQHILYTTGVFGLTFNFELFWSTAVQNEITFRNPSPMGAVHLLKGKYTFADLGDGKTSVHFQIVADIRGPIPDFVKMAIARLIVHIALDDLNTYVTSDRCIQNLAKYDKEAGKGALQTIRTHITRLYTDVPDGPFKERSLRTVVKGFLRVAMAGLLFKRFFAREGGEQQPQRIANKK